MFHVQREVWRLPLEGCDMGFAVVVESLADGAIDCQAIADFANSSGTLALPNTLCT